MSRAAERLHLTQPAVSLKLKQLQHVLGLTLFKRRPQGLELTADGHALLPSAEKALAACQAFERTARAMHDTPRGRLRIGTIVDPEFIRLGAFLHHLVERAPQVRTELHHGMSGSVLERVRRGELDVGFYLAPPGAGVEETEGVAFLELTYFDYHVIAPAGWASRMEGADWSRLATLPWIVTPHDSAHHRLLGKVLEPLGITLNEVARVDQEACMLDLVRAGIGLSLARDALAMAERQERGLVIARAIRVPCALVFIWPRNRSEESLIGATLEVLQQVWKVKHIDRYGELP